METKLRYASYFIGMIFAVSIPFLISSNYWLYMFTIALIYIIVVASLDLLYGYTGLISLGHAAFFGIGAYACGILQVKAGFPFSLSIILGTCITGLCALVIGWPMIRIKGPYFALGTLALGLIVEIIIHNWDGLTGGVSLDGISLPSTLNILGLTVDFSSKRTFYYFALLFTGLSIFFIRRMTRSRLGRAVQAIRENDDLADALGINIIYYKLLVFVVSCTIAGLAGGIYAAYMGSIEPAICKMSFPFMVMVVVGGPQTIAGVILGPLLIWFLPEFLDAAQVYRPLFYGFILLVVIIFMSEGIIGKIRSFHPRLAKWIQ